MKPDSVDIAFLYESFCEFTEHLQEAWENSPEAARDGQQPHQLIDAMSQLAGILRNIEAAGQPAEPGQDIHTLGEFGLQLLSELSDIAATLEQKDAALGLQNLCLPMAVWAARHGGEIRHLGPVVSALAYFANHNTEAKFMAQLLGLSDEIYRAVSPKISEDLDRREPTRPWRMLVLNRAIIATHTLQPTLMEPAFDSVVEHLPEDAAGFFEEGLEQVESFGYPEPVLEIVTRYYRAFGKQRILH